MEKKYTQVDNKKSYNKPEITQIPLSKLTLGGGDVDLDTENFESNGTAS
jgi:hypothetical protein